MVKIKSVGFVIGFISFSIYGQELAFKQVPPLQGMPQNISNFTSVFFSGLAFADVDGDGDEDVLITGYTGHAAEDHVSELYINDGLGNYELLENTPFIKVHLSSVAFSDVDGDNDQDVLICGRDANWENSSTLYINDGTGSYTISENLPFIGVNNGSVHFEDIDGDNDKDVFITGLVSNSTASSNLYINNGMGDFELMEDNPIIAFKYSNAAFGDIDGDNDADLIVMGQDNDENKSTKLYLNNGL